MPTAGVQFRQPYIQATISYTTTVSSGEDVYEAQRVQLRRQEGVSSVGVGSFEEKKKTIMVIRRSNSCKFSFEFKCKGNQAQIRQCYVEINVVIMM